MIKREKDDLIKEGAMKENSWMGLNERKTVRSQDCNIENGGKERKIIRKDKNKKKEEKKITFLFNSFKILFICDIIPFFSTYLCSFRIFLFSCCYFFLLFLLLSFLLSLFFVCLYLSFKTCSHYHRQTPPPPHSHRSRGYLNYLCSFPSP